MQQCTIFVLDWLVLMKLRVYTLVVHTMHDLAEISCFRCLLVLHYTVFY